MKILIPILGFDRAGGNRVLSKLADELIFLGHEVYFLCPNKSDLPYFPSSARILWVDRYGKTNSCRVESRRKENAFSIQQKLTRALRSGLADSFDIIIANQSFTTLPIKMARLLPKTIYYVQAYEPELFNSKSLKNRILHYISELSYGMKLFTVVNAEPYRNYKKLKSSRVLYPGVDFTLFYPKKQRISPEYHKIIIGTIGRTELHKGTRYIIDAFKKISKKYPNAELHIAFGNKEEYKDFSNIYCVQPHGDKALGDFYRSLDFYICAGYVQLGAFHYPVVEAMSCGVSVITTEYFPANESNSWLIKKLQSSGEIIAQFEKALANQPLQESKIQQALIDVKKFDWKRIGQQLNQYIEELKNQLDKN